MSGEDISLREYVERVVSDLERHHHELHVELQRAVDMADQAQVERTAVALAAIDKRLDGMNEFRKSLEDVTNKAVSRDIFDIVTNRVTVVENTYLKREDYTKDVTTAQDRHQNELKERDRRITDLEQTSVRTDALQTQSAEVARTRKALAYTIAGGVILTGINLIINVVQSKP